MEASGFPEMGVSREKDNRREYVRVDDLLRVDYRGISQEEYKKHKTNPDIIFKNIFGDPVMTPDIEEVDLNLLYKLIYQANLKMDRILELLDTKDTDRYISVGAEYVNISGSGMKFITAKGFPIGDVIALRVFLPLVSSTWIRVMGEVTSSKELAQGEGYSTAIRFFGLTDSDREEIIRHVFKKQREHLRITSDIKNRDPEDE